MSKLFLINSTLIALVLGVLVRAPLVEARPMSATYYHPSLAGRTKANGRPYNPAALTAASNVFRLGTRVRVTNPANGRSVVVTITDRCGNCSIDLSTAAFQRLAPLRQGRVPVRVNRI